MQQKQNTTGLVWFQNNLRITDNNSLLEACKNHETVIAVFVFDVALFDQKIFGFNKIDKFRTQFLIESVADLRQNLEKLNITLLTYFDFSDTVIPSFCKEHQVDTIYIQKEWTKEEIEIVENVKQKLTPSTKIIATFDQFLYHPNDIKMNFKDVPKVFTQFRKYLEKQISIRDEVAITKMPKNNLVENSTKIPTLNQLGFEVFEQPKDSAFPFDGGESSAEKRLQHYFFETKKLGVYKKTRNGLIGIDYSSKFSAWLANGAISAKTIYYKVKEYENQFGSNDSTYWLIFELIWRDYFKYISLKHGDTIFKIGGILNKDYEWNTDSTKINQWINGETKEPFVNANMIELKETGWMSNRGRQNVASYFAKELELDWRIGSAYFESVLIDYDVHSNYGNWMYVAGVGNDPRDRKFNIKTQADRYDSGNKYQNLWLQKRLF